MGYGVIIAEYAKNLITIKLSLKPSQAPYPIPISSFTFGYP
jgi:hypothetical protein